MKLAESILQQLGESLTKADVNQIASDLNSMRNILGPDGHDPAEVSFSGNNFTVSKSYRNYSLFKERDGEEDDDSPIFVGRDTVLKKLKSAFSSFKKIKIEAGSDEKKWFTVYITGEYDSSLDSLPLEKRPIGVVTKDETWKWAAETLPAILQPVLSKLGKTLNKKDLKLDPFWIGKTSSTETYYTTVIPLGILHTTEEKSGHMTAVSGEARMSARDGILTINVYPKSSEISLSQSTPQNLHGAELKGKKATLENAAKELVKGAKEWDAHAKVLIKKIESSGRKVMKSSNTGFTIRS